MQSTRPIHALTPDRVDHWLGPQQAMAVSPTSMAVRPWVKQAKLMLSAKTVWRSQGLRYQSETFSVNSGAQQFNEFWHDTIAVPR